MVVSRETTLLLGGPIFRAMSVLGTEGSPGGDCSLVGVVPTYYIVSDFGDFDPPNDGRKKKRFPDLFRPAGLERSGSAFFGGKETVASIMQICGICIQDLREKTNILPNSIYIHFILIL